MIFSLLIIACVLALVLVFMAFKRIHNEGLVLTEQKKQHFKRSVEDVQRQNREEKASIHVDDDSLHESVVYTRFGFGKQLNLGIAAAVNAVKKALADEGFEVLNSADVAKILHKTEMPGYQMLHVYHPELAGRAVDMEPSIGLLQSAVIVRQDFSDSVHLEFSDPALVTGSAKNSDLNGIAIEMKTRLRRVLQAS